MLFKKSKTKQETISVELAVGKMLLHDITQIIPGKFKGAAFNKGHIIRPEDIKPLKSMGKENIYTYEIANNEYHENDAAHLFKLFAGQHVKSSEPSEGKINFISDMDGMVIIDKNTVHKINQIYGMAYTTIHSYTKVKKGDILAGIRIIPLSLKKSLVHKALKYGHANPIVVKPFVEKKIGLVVTGTEVASGRIQDKFRPVIEKKMAGFNCQVDRYAVAANDPESIQKQLLDMKAAQCQFIILTGGMSVDPDDTTKLAIRRAGVDIVKYGAPVLPGNMLMVGYLDTVPIIGLPACAMYHNITVFDLLLPYIFSNTKITDNDIIFRGYGGLCRHCQTCVFPTCALGKF